MYGRKHRAAADTPVSRVSALSKKLQRRGEITAIGVASVKCPKGVIATEVKRLPKKGMSMFFKMTSPIPKDFHLPSDICSPSSFEHLSKICTTLRQSKYLQTPLAAHGLRHIIQAPDSLGKHLAIASVLRRHFLVSLKAHRIGLEEAYQQSASIQTRQPWKQRACRIVDARSCNDAAYNRSDAQALEAMTEEAYPDLLPTRRAQNGTSDEK